MMSTAYITESIACDKRVQAIMKVNMSLCGRYAIGDRARVNNELSEYYGLVGKVVEISRLNDSGTLEFTDKELSYGYRPEGLLRARRRVYFYWRELQQIICN